MPAPQFTAMGFTGFGGDLPPRDQRTSRRTLRRALYGYTCSMKFAIAGREHEPALRAMLRSDAMPGLISLSYQHEPDYFRSLSAGDREPHVIVALEKDEVVGTGFLTRWIAMVNGSPGPTGYLGGLRSLKRVRGGIGLVKGFRFLRNLHRDLIRQKGGSAPAYLTTILEENVNALELFEAGRAGLPNYHPLGRFFTRAVLANWWRGRGRSGLEIVSASELGWPAVVAFLDAHGGRRQFGPHADCNSLARLADLGLPADRFLLATDSGVIRACAGLWDTGCFRQHVVRGYSGVLGRLRPLANAALRLGGYFGLPRVGQELHLPFAAFVVSDQDDPGPLGALFERFHQIAVTQAWHGFLVGFHEHDPLAEALRFFRIINYPSRLYLVHWEDGADFVNGLDPILIPYLEPALL